MKPASKRHRSRCPAHAPRVAFTLVELLAVIAIIVLLMGILVPSISKAREQAKATQTRSMFKAIGDGLEMFRADNESEIRGYPPSRAADDPTEDGRQFIFGAQWLVRYLVGKDLLGYVPKRNVPSEMLQNVTEFWEQRDWYASTPTAYNRRAPLPRVGPYVKPDGLKFAKPAELPGAPESFSFIDCDEKTGQQLVMLDTFGFPILYYAATPVRGPALACYDGRQNGIYTFKDNGLFTGLCKGTMCTYPPWPFTEREHKIKDFGGDDPTRPETIASNTETFPYYILNKNAFESTSRRSAVPHRSDTFLLISAGKDGVYGTEDDVANFDR